MIITASTMLQFLVDQNHGYILYLAVEDHGFKSEEKKNLMWKMWLFSSKNPSSTRLNIFGSSFTSGNK